MFVCTTKVSNLFSFLQAHLVPDIISGITTLIIIYSSPRIAAVAGTRLSAFNLLFSFKTFLSGFFHHGLLALSFLRLKQKFLGNAFFEV